MAEFRISKAGEILLRGTIALGSELSARRTTKLVAELTEQGCVLEVRTKAGWKRRYVVKRGRRYYTRMSF